MQSIEERVARLEQVIFNRNRTVEKDAWINSVGTVTDDIIAESIIDEAIRIREAERTEARKEYESEFNANS